ncbi:MAG TPA: LLM class flavin-dependent oxidoreductase, partial [Ktedonobacterales bacterium]|nr:LLM class flavin-dependent oxidoreductase [Ktedonobacterales bacterium]
GLLAKMVTTLDVLSGGRAMLAIGAGDYPEEAQGLGLPFPPLGERFDILEETVQACLRMWTGEQGGERPFHGRYVQMERPLNVPQSLSRPHPPILIAGSGERRTLPLVARYADACNIRPSPEIPRQLELLRRLCEQEGRDYDAIEKTAPFGFDVGADGSKVGELLSQLRWLADMGIQTVLGWVVGVDSITPIEIMGREVIPAVAEL